MDDDGIESAFDLDIDGDGFQMKRKLHLVLTHWIRIHWSSNLAGYFYPTHKSRENLPVRSLVGILLVSIPMGIQPSLITWLKITSLFKMPDPLRSQTKRNTSDK